MFTQTQKRYCVSLVSLVAAAWLLIGCGSGNKDGGTPSEAELLAADKTAITEDNAPIVALAAASSGSMSLDRLGLPLLESSLSDPLVRQTERASTPSLPLEIAQYINQTGRISASKTVAASTTTPCTVEGNITTTDNGNLRTITFDSCNNKTALFSGSLSASRLDWSGYDYAHAYTADLNISYPALSTDKSWKARSRWALATNGAC